MRRARIAISMAAMICAACGRLDGAAPAPGCMTPAQAARLEADRRYDVNARRLADYYDACRHDRAAQTKWLRIAAERGDREAMRKLIALLEASHVGDPREIRHWRKVIAE